VVTNVTNFGAFVDVGVHQDGLVHISMMSHKFVKDPRELVKAGDVVKVKVLEVDLQRRRVALTMKLDAPAQRSDEPRRDHQPAGDRNRDRGDRNRGDRGGGARQKVTGGGRESQSNGAMAEAWAQALKRR
jgi:uncharacterized protein